MIFLTFFSFFELFYYYDDLNTRVLKEYFILDISSVLTNIGGNMGLLLGYSSMTILLAMIEAFKHIVKRKQTKRNRKSAAKK